MFEELILVVDDEPIFSLARIYIEQDGDRLINNEDGEKSLRRDQDLRSDLVLRDMMLANIEGLEVCQLLQAKKDYTPVLMLTARGDDIDKILELDFGADTNMTKSFNPHEMVAHVGVIPRRDVILEKDISGHIQIGDMSFYISCRFDIFTTGG